eukprot:7352136-Prymnesium_polylepis.1
MESAHGELFDLLDEEGPLSESRARGIIRQLCAGVAHCHACGVAHRDLKLDNALLDGDGVVKLIDFGLSHQYARDPATGAVDHRTPLRGACGSRSYAAPELLARLPYDGFEAD